ncbi:MAG TPA: shikimate kinase [Patescibacteria group bacterium]|nr:shikimate kinase [Patescibacteria group bacterium]
MGSGKSSVGALVAERAGAPFHDLDRMIEAESGQPVQEIFASRGEASFRELEKRLLPEALEPGSVVALGGGAVIDDASWRLVATRAVTVYLEVAFSTIWERIRGTGGRPLIAGRSRVEVERLFERRRSRYLEAAHRVDAARDVGVVAGEVLQLWSA